MSPFSKIKHELGKTRRPLSITEISNRLGLDKDDVSDILQEMHEHEMLDVSSLIYGKYWLKANIGAV